MPTSQPDGFLATPTTPNGRGVLVLHAWWGLNDAFKGVATRLAQEGYLAFAADLYHGRVAKTVAEAELLGGETDQNPERTANDTISALQYLSEQVEVSDKLAVVAFSLGGHYALQLSNGLPNLVRAVVLFYGTSGTLDYDFSKSRASYLGHFAELDEYESPANVDRLEAALQQAGRPVTFYRYPAAHHHFVEPNQPQAYDPAAALAWDRTLAFLKR